jgi:hypothetical protein
MSSQLDCAFYTSFYDDLSSLAGATKLEITEHYLNIGKAQGRVANNDELVSVMSSILNFNPDLYSVANLSYQLDKSLKDTFVGKNDWYQHFYSSPNGNLYIASRYRVINNNDLKITSNEWDELVSAIFDIVHFSVVFYKSFYNIPSTITTVQDLKIHWLKNGLFLKQHPNLQSFTDNRDVIGDIQAMLIDKFKLNMAFLANYKADMMKYASHHSIVVPESITDENSILLFLFMNTGYQLRLFYNQNELDAYRTDNINKYNEALASVKSMTHVKALATSVKLYTAQTASLVKSKHIVVPVPIVKDLFININSVFNVIKLCNPTFLNCFKKISQNEDLMVIIPLLVKHELLNCDQPQLNSMEVKILVASLLYNLFISNKSDSTLYANFVKEKSVELLSAMFNEAGLVDFSETLKQDVDFIVENKKVVKLCSLTNLIISLFFNAFLLNL